MCLDPLSIAAMALSAAGTIYNTNTMNNAIEAQNEANWNAFQMANNARKLEQERQSGLEAQRRGSLLETANEVDPGRKLEELDPASDAALSEVLENRIADDSLPTLSFGSDAGKEAMSQVANRVVASKRAELEAANRLRAAGNAFSDDALAIRRGLAFQDLLGDKMQGSLGVSMQERDITPPTYRPGNTLMGDILIGAGQFAGHRAGYNAGYNVGVGG